MPPLPLADGRVHPREPSPVEVAPPPLNDGRPRTTLSPGSAQANATSPEPR